MKDNLESLAQRLDEVTVAAQQVLKGVESEFESNELARWAIETIEEAQQRRRILTLIIRGFAGDQ
jgi:C4-type Zn-finger protein